MKREAIYALVPGDLQPDGTRPQAARKRSTANVWPRMLEDAERGTVPIAGWGVKVFGAKHGVTPNGRVEIRGKVYEVDGAVAQHPKFAIFMTKGLA